MYNNLKLSMFNPAKNTTLELVPVQNNSGRRVVVRNSRVILSLDIILGISVIISILGIIILG